MTRPRQLPARPRTAVPRRRGRVLAAVTAFLALVVGGTDVFLLTQGRASTEVELDTVLQDFREAGGDTRAEGRDGAPVLPDPIAAASEPRDDDTADDADAAGAVTDPAGETGSAPRPTTSDDPGAPAPPMQPATTEPTTRDDPSADDAVSVRLPAEGVYEYRTDGQETVSIGGGRHDYPERTYASVRHDGGCDYTVEHRWVEEHVEQHHRCNQGTDMLGVATSAQVTFFGQTETRNMHCDPPVIAMRLTDQADTSREFACAGDDTEYRETVTYLGEEAVLVGGVEVMARRVLATGTLEGRSTGSSRHERWIHPEDGTVLKGIRHVETESEAFGTTVTYVEDVTYTLVSLTPRR